MTHTRIALVFLTAVVALSAGPAAAQKHDKERADALFKQGKKLMAEQRYAEACQDFEDSFKLDPGIGGELNVAKCYQEWGKLERAYRAYQQADQMAKDAGDSREPKIVDLMHQLEPQVPKLTLKLPAGAAPKKLVVVVDGEELGAAAVGKVRRVDPGPHTIDWTADDGTKHSKAVALERGGSSEVILEVPVEQTMETTEGGPHRGKHRDDDEAPDPGRGWRLGAYISAGVGVALISVSSALAVSAHSQYTSALSADCGGKTNMCNAVGLTQTHDARSKANIATGLFVGGVAAVGGGVVLYLLAPRASHGEHALRVVPHLDGNGGGLALDGRF